MLTLEQKKHVDAFEYWVKTNTENGVSIIPESICKEIIAILKDDDENYEQNEWTCKGCKHKEVWIYAYPCSECHGGSKYAEEGSESHDDN